MSSSQRSVTVAVTAALSWTAYHFDLLPYLDALGTIVALEYNNVAIRKRQEMTRQQQPERTSSYIACCIGYQESEATFERCVRSYKSAAPGCAAYLCMLDGTFEENASMVEVFEREWDTLAEHRISYERPLGEMCEEIVHRTMAAKGNTLNSGEAAVKALAEVYQYARQRVEGIVPLAKKTSGTGILPLLVSQPHVGLKEVRFAAWITSIVLADILQVEYLWSSDSDSRVQPDCVSDCVATLVGDDTAGAASATLAVQDCRKDLFNRLYSGYYQGEHLLQRAPSACMGTVSCIHGPSGCYRVRALRPLLVEWYTQRVWGRKLWINEDAHITALLLREGWSTLYVPTAIVENEAVASYMAWFKQTMRWERAGQWERYASPTLTFNPSQGVVRLIIALRDLLLRPYLFAYIVILATTGRHFPASHPLLGVAFIVSQFVQKGWNFVRLRRARKNPMGYWIAAAMYVLGGPFAYVWGVGTLLEDTWESTTKKLSMPVLGFFCFALWTVAVGVAFARLLLAF